MYVASFLSIFLMRNISPSYYSLYAYLGMSVLEIIIHLHVYKVTSIVS